MVMGKAVATQVPHTEFIIYIVFSRVLMFNDAYAKTPALVYVKRHVCYKMSVIGGYQAVYK